MDVSRSGVRAVIIAAMSGHPTGATSGAIVDSGGDDTVAQLIVRNIDAALVGALKLRAARNGRSAEAEHREILRQALTADVTRPSFVEFLMTMPDVGEDEDFERATDYPREIEW
jgi:antitoxin FitA